MNGLPRSLRARLWAQVVVTAVILGGVAAAVTLTVRGQLYRQVDARLSSFASAARPGRMPVDPMGSGRMRTDQLRTDQLRTDQLRDRPADGLGDVADRPSDVYRAVVVSGRVVTVFAPNAGTTRLSPPRLAPGSLRPGSLRPGARVTARFFDAPTRRGDGTYRVLVQYFPRRVTVTAVPIDDVRASITALLRLELAAALAIMLALAATTWWTLRMGVNPMVAMTRAASRIASGEHDVRLPSADPGTEAGELAEALNVMIATLDSALQSETSSRARLQRFVADASHELRTPIATISGYAELYRLGALTDPDVLHDALRRTESEALRMGRLVDELLMLARLDEDRPVEEADVDVVELAGDVVADMTVTHPGHHVTVRAQAAADAGTVIGDRDRLQQLLINVVGNAVTHTPEGTQVTVTVTARHDEVLVVVADDGPGMGPEVAMRATERFFRGDPSRSRASGGTSGLGLAIAESIATAHGGTLTVESTLGSGTLVELVLPARRAAPDAERPAS